MKASYICCWDGCKRTRMGDTSLCAKHHNQAHRERGSEGKVSLREQGRCLMPGCLNRITDLPNLHLCRAHLAIVAEQVRPRPHIAELTDLDAYTTARQQAEQEAAERRQAMREAERQPVVYYVQVGAHIKIGWTSDLQSRMRNYPPNSVLLAVHPGSRADEARLHKRFAHHRTHGREWYAPVPSVLHHIAQVKAEHGEPEQVTFGAQPVTIPEPRPTQYVAMRSRSGASYPRASA